MSKEQLKQLKPGDEIFIRARFKKTYADGDVSFLHSNTNVYDVEREMESYTHQGNVILPPPAPKYDPCRLFKKWDRVRPVVRYGRYPDDGALANVTYVVVDDEKNGRVSIARHDGKSGYAHTVTALYLELVTPVEELEPFSVCQDAEMECFEVYKCEYTEGEEGNEKVWKIVRTTYFYGDNQGLRTLAEAKEAAEAECARLNAEYRKEQK